MNWDIKKKQPNRTKEEKESKKNEDSVNSPWDKFKVPAFALQGCQKEKRKSKKSETYLKKQ